MQNYYCKLYKGTHGFQYKGFPTLIFFLKTHLLWWPPILHFQVEKCQKLFYTNFEKTWEAYNTGDWLYDDEGNLIENAKNPIYAEQMMDLSSMNYINFYEDWFIVLACTINWANEIQGFIILHKKQNFPSVFILLFKICRTLCLFISDQRCVWGLDEQFCVYLKHIFLLAL